MFGVGIFFAYACVWICVHIMLTIVPSHACICVCECTQPVRTRQDRFGNVYSQPVIKKVNKKEINKNLHPFNETRNQMPYSSMRPMIAKLKVLQQPRYSREEQLGPLVAQEGLLVLPS